MKNFLRISTLFIVGLLCFFPAPHLWSGTVIGVMQMQDGTPMSGGKVIVFLGDEGPPPLLSEDTRMPEIAEDLDNEGAFNINLEEGTYYIGAVQWRDGRGPGKPEKGDNFFLMRTRPVQVPAEGVVDLGAIPRGETIR